MHLSMGCFSGFCRFLIELDTPTIARMTPTKIKRWDSFSATNASQTKSSSPTIRLNRQTPCPPRGAVPFSTRARFCKSVSSQRARFAFGHGYETCSVGRVIYDRAGQIGKVADAGSFHLFPGRWLERVEWRAAQSVVPL